MNDERETVERLAVPDNRDGVFDKVIIQDRDRKDFEINEDNFNKPPRWRVNMCGYLTWRILKGHDNQEISPSFPVGLMLDEEIDVWTPGGKYIQCPNPGCGKLNLWKYAKCGDCLWPITQYKIWRSSMSWNREMPGWSITYGRDCSHWGKVPKWIDTKRFSGGAFKPTNRAWACYTNVCQIISPALYIYHFNLQFPNNKINMETFSMASYTQWEESHHKFTRVMVKRFLPLVWEIILDQGVREESYEQVPLPG